MNIKVRKVAEKREHTSLTGGECATSRLVIDIDKKLSARRQRELVIHAVVENYNRGMPHEKVDELTEFIMHGLDQLGGNDE
ncbi:hypothetical protein LCGC14_1409210 [marine sediment metagenome]|uniref:Uncharacterized protein n=1 Tax=marine sediment metagenome TaxID=412755 RepID=A0A0F9MA62_9ZZZZ